MTNSLVHNDGTVAVTANSDQVVGTLTGWEFGLVKAGIFSVAGYAIPIYSVEDDTHLTLAYPYPGPNAAGLSYAIALDTTDGARRAGTWTVQRLGDLARTPWGVGVIPDGRGTLAQRDALDPMPTDNYCWLRVEIDEPLEFYFRVAGQWVGPYELRGEASDIPGPPGAAGTGFILRGEYDNLTLYNKNDTVWFGDYTFASKVDSNTGNEPPSTPTDDANWQYVPTVQGLKGDPGDGAYVYVAYASDDSGTDFTLTFDPALNYIAILATTVEIPAPAVGDFAGLWKNYKGSQGLAGLKGWSPVFAIVSDGNRRVLQVSDWVGGEGVKPTTGEYVGATGLTPTIGDAIDIRGPAGSGTGNVNTSGSAVTNRIVTYADTSGNLIKDSGQSVADVLNRANHTGQQLASTISNFSTAADARISAAIGQTVQGYSAALASWSGVTRASGFDTFAATPSSANLLTLLTTKIGTGLAVFSSAIREKLTANRTYYVRTDGNDSNNGLANTSGGAFLTIQKAIDTVAAIDMAGFTAIIQVGAGTYAEALTLKSLVGGFCIIVGDEVTPSNVLINAVGSCFTADAIVGTWHLRGMKFQATTHGIGVTDGAIVKFQNIDFGTTSFYHMLATGGRLVATGNYTISGSANRHIYLFAGSSMQCQARTVTLTGSLTFAVFFQATTASAGTMSGNTYSGTATGKRYDATLNAVIATAGGGANYFPGDVAGTVSTGGQYS